jgi:hypothetical protein
VPNDEIDENAGINADGSITEDAPATKMIGVIVKNAIDEYGSEMALITGYMPLSIGVPG